MGVAEGYSWNTSVCSKHQFSASTQEMMYYHVSKKQQQPSVCECANQVLLDVHITDQQQDSLFTYSLILQGRLLLVSGGKTLYPKSEGELGLPVMDPFCRRYSTAVSSVNLKSTWVVAEY